ncbi:MAG: NYN domain-containing protein [Jatrophihabitantaceae bacterium]
MSSAEQTEPTGGSVVLAGPARQQVVQIASDVLGRLKSDEIPPPLRAIAKFTSARRRQRGAVPIAAALDSDAEFRARVADVVAETLPVLVEAIRSGASTAASDPSDVAAVAYLVRPDGWEAIVADATARWTEQRGHAAGISEERGRLQGELADLRARLKAEVARSRDAINAAGASSAAELAELKKSLRARTGERRAAERDRDAAQQALADAQRRAEQAESSREAEGRRLRARITELERASGSARREARTDRDVDDARLWLLLQTLTDAAAGVRRELSLAPPSMRPADGVIAAGTDLSRRSADDPAALDRLLSLPQAHLVVDGYNVTKTGYGELALADQRDRLVTALAALAGRCGAEITVAFDGGTRPAVQPRTPRGVRVLFSSGEQIADDLIRSLVDAEPPGRAVIVVTSDQQVVADVRRAGAWTVPSAVLLARL